MRKLIYFCLFALLLVRVHAATPAPNSATLLPDQFGDWHATGNSQTLSPQSLVGPFAPGTAGERILKESGVSKIEERSYQASGSNGEQTITVRAIQAHDPTSAFEVYTYMLAPGMKDLGIGENSAGGSKDGRFLIGNIVVEANFPDSVKPQILAGLLQTLKPKADRMPLPPIQGYLPAKSLVKGSEKYALGPEAFHSALATLNQSAYDSLTREAGFESGAEAMLARYESGGGHGVLVMLEYPTPQLAEQHLHHLEGELPAAAKQAGTKIERKASLLSVVLESPSQEFANKLREDINYETSVTWNEGSHILTEPPLVVMIIKIFTFTGFFLVIATGLGLAFGVFRVFVKRYFPGKIFDRPEDVEVIQMGLSGKKIDSSDMY